MVMTALRNGTQGGMLKYILLGLLVLAGGGLVFTDVGGFFRGGVTSGDVATVAGQSIPITQFDQRVRSAVGRLGMTPEQAHQMGYTRELLNGEVRSALLLRKAADVGLRIGDAQVAENIQDILAPMSAPGQKPSEVLSQLLASQGMSEQQLIHSIKREMSSSLLSNAVQSGVMRTSKAMIRDMARYQSETRDVQYVMFKDADFAGDVAPSEAQLKTLYESTKEAYAIPEMRKVAVISIDAAKIKATLEISEEEIAETYERNINAYKEPEMRKVEQAIIVDAAKAGAVADAVRGGTTLRAAMQSIVGNVTDILPLENLEKADLIEELQKPVFAAKAGDIVGPVETALGQYVVSVEGASAPRTRALAEVKAVIMKDLIEERTIDAQFEVANALDDALAGGADLKTVEADLGVKVQPVGFVDAYGFNAEGKPAFAAFGEDSQDLAASTAELEAGQASQVLELAKGGMAAVYVEDLQPKAYKPFAEVQGALKTQWVNDFKRVENEKAVRGIVEGKAVPDLTALAQSEGRVAVAANGLVRAGEPVAPFDPLAVQAIFNAQEGGVFVVPLKDGSAIVKLVRLSIPAKPSADALVAAENSVLEAQQSEGYTMYMQTLEDEYGVKVNEKLLNSVYGAAQE